MEKNPQVLAANFTTRVRRRGLWDMIGAAVKIEIRRGILYKPISHELVVIDQYAIPPEENKRQIFNKVSVLYFIFNNPYVGLEIHLRDDGTIHAQVIRTSTERGETYEQAHVVFNNTDLGWFPYLQQLKR